MHVYVLGIIYMFISCESFVRVFDYKAICRICFHYWLFSSIIPCPRPISCSHILKWIQWNILRKTFPVFWTIRIFKKFTQHIYKKNPCKSLLHCNYKMCRSFPFYFWKSKYAFCRRVVKNLSVPYWLSQTIYFSLYL